MSQKSKTSGHRPGHRETFNQIILMLIVAFTLRVFVVEAFVIPTGSMATTLKGAHSRFTCENCGYAFDVNFSSSQVSASGDINIPRTAANTSNIYCPNCGYAVPDEQKNKLAIFYGDRILVLKYAYLLKDPERWDVVVFKTPASPERYHYGQAYIKRLIGKPGERVMILDGDIYVTSATNPTDADWKIQSKPQVVQEALWRIVNDADFRPLGLTPENKIAYETYGVESYVPWKTSDKNWIYTRDSSGGTAFDFRDPEGRGVLKFDREIGSRTKHTLTDFLAYDQVTGPNPMARVGQFEFTPVSDLKLSMFYRRGVGKGPLELKLSKRNDVFTAVLEPDGVALYRSRLDTPEKRQLLEKRPFAFPDRPIKVELMNVDYRVSLRLDGQTILTTTPQDYAPNVRVLKQEQSLPPYPTVEISASRQVATVTHLALWRDTYYTNTQVYRNDRMRRGGVDNPVVLGADEYFTLGDNSPLSEDGRYWTDPVNLPAEGIVAQAGVVPARFLQGQALMVYWPAGFRMFSENFLDLVPNYGEMRLIH